MKKRWFKSEIAIVIAAAVVMFVVLMLSPIIGVADNGDFDRIMTAGGIYYDADESYQDRYFSYFHQQYEYVAAKWGGYVSTQILIVLVAGLVGRVLNGDFFDIRVLSFMYAVMYLAALYIWMKYNKSESKLLNAVTVAIAVFVFVDIGYIAYFNSFFGEAITLIFMLMTLGFGLAVVQSKEPSKRLLLFFYIASFCLVCTKLQNAPIGLLLILIGLRFWSIRTDRSWRKMIFISSAVLLFATAVMYFAAPKDLKNINLYQTVFFGILKDSPNPEAALKELGLPVELKVLAGTNYFQGDTAIKQNDPILFEYLYNRLGHKDVLLYYMKNPSRFIQKMERGAENGMTIRPYYLGSYDQSEGKPKGAVAYTFSGWSQFKREHVPNTLAFVILIYVLYYAGVVFEYTRKHNLRDRARVDIFAGIGLIGMFGFAVPLLGDGEADLGKHLFLFNVCFDLMLVVGLIYMIRKVVGLVRRSRG